MRTFDRVSQVYPVTEQVFNIPPNALRKFAGARGTFTREAWPAGVNYVDRDGVTRANSVMAVLLEVSLDDVQWASHFDLAFVGGVRARTVDEFRFSFTGLKDGAVRFRIKILASLRTAVHLEMFEDGD